MTAIRSAAILVLVVAVVFLNTRTEVVQVVGGASKSTEWIQVGWPFGFYSWRVQVVNQRVPKFGWANIPRITLWERLDGRSNLYLANLFGNVVWWAWAGAICTEAIKKKGPFRFQMGPILAIHVLVAVTLAR